MLLSEGRKEAEEIQLSWEKVAKATPEFRLKTYNLLSRPAERPRSPSEEKETEVTGAEWKDKTFICL